MKLSTAVLIVVEDLQVHHGSIRSVARVLSLDSAYLCRLLSGEKVNPSDVVLRKLKIKKIVDYEIID